LILVHGCLGLISTRHPTVSVVTPAAGRRNVPDTGRDDAAAMMILARSGFGRILLHLGALLGDGALRFHAAGITRELRASWPRR
jgi:hypothetical protein